MKLQLLDTLKGTSRVDLLNQLVLDYEYVNPDSSRMFADEAISLAEELEYYEGHSDALLYLGYLLDDKGDYYKSIESLEGAARVAIELHDTIRISRVQNNLGNVRFHLGHFEIALKHYYSALELQEFSIKDSIRIAVIKTNIGSLLVKLDEQEAALESFAASLAFYRSKGYMQQVSVVLANMAVSFTTLHRYDESLKVLEEALAINIELNNNYSRGITLVNIAGVKYDLGLYQEALDNHEAALVAFEAVGDKYHTINTIKNIAMCYGRTGRLK